MQRGRCGQTGVDDDSRSRERPLLSNRKSTHAAYERHRHAQAVHGV